MWSPQRRARLLLPLAAVIAYTACDSENGRNGSPTTSERVEVEASAFQEEPMLGAAIDYPMYSVLLKFTNRGSKTFIFDKMEVAWNPGTGKAMRASAPGKLAIDVRDIPFHTDLQDEHGRVAQRVYTLAGSRQLVIRYARHPVEYYCIGAEASLDGQIIALARRIRVNDKGCLEVDEFHYRPETVPGKPIYRCRSTYSRNNEKSAEAASEGVKVYEVFPIWPFIEMP
jgi:hypothetical protein